MVELSGVVSVFSSLIWTDKGRSFRGAFGEAPKVGVHFTGLLTPVRLLSVPPGEELPPGEIVLDADGTRYIAGNWAANAVFGRPVCQNYILFEVHAYVEWTRAVTTLEPISGQRRTAGTQLLGTIGVLREPLAVQRDGLGVEIERYRYLTGERVQLGDFLEGKRALRVDYVNKLWFVEAQ